MAARPEALTDDEFHDVACMASGRRTRHGERVVLPARGPAEAARASWAFTAGREGPAGRRRLRPEDGWGSSCGNGSQ